MKIKILIITSMLFLASLIFAQTANLELGKQKAQACAACHGPDGNSPLPNMPKIAGQNEKYFIEQMLNFKQGAKSGRDNAIMHGIAQGLSNQDIIDLAAYFAEQKPSIGVANPKLVKQGQAIYKGGVMAQGIPACSACHGPRGKGNSEAGFPLLSGQHSEYIVQQLQAYKDGKRRNDINNIMGSIAKKMSPQEIKAVASYISGLH